MLFKFRNAQRPVKPDPKSQALLEVLCFRGARVPPSPARPRVVTSGTLLLLTAVFLNGANCDDFILILRRVVLSRRPVASSRRVVPSRRPGPAIRCDGTALRQHSDSTPTALRQHGDSTATARRQHDERSSSRRQTNNKRRSMILFTVCAAQI